jgi:hypothetical protein
MVARIVFLVIEGRDIEGLGLGTANSIGTNNYFTYEHFLRAEMPRRPTHITAGCISGLAAGILTSKKLPTDHQLLHVVCATIGGTIGGLAPDSLEPALSPHHRSLFHSLAVGSAAGSGLIANWQARCHEAAAACVSRAEQAPLGSAQRSEEEAKALLWRAVAGLLVGFLAGYLSHLALDAGTSSSLPLFVNGF